MNDILINVRKGQTLEDYVKTLSLNALKIAILDERPNERHLILTILQKEYLRRLDLNVLFERRF
jgi:hypothetical protein